MRVKSPAFPLRLFPRTLLFFGLIIYFTLFDQPGFIPSVKTLTVGVAWLIFVPWLLIKVKRRTLLPETPLDILFAGVIGLHLVSALLSASFRLTFYNLWLLLFSVLLFYWLLDQLKAGRENSLWQATFLVATIVLELAVLEFLVWYLGLVPQLGFEISWPQVAGWTLPPNPRHLGLALLTVPVAPPFSAYVALFIPLALGLALSARKFSSRLGLAGFILLSLIILLLTFSRTGLVTLAVALTALMLLAWFKYWQARLHLDPAPQPVFAPAPGERRHKWPVWLIAGMAVTLLIIGFFNWAYLTAEVLENRSGSNQIRLALIQAAWLMWQEHPLLGMGPGLFGLFYRNYIPPNSFFLLNLSTHSFYFQMLAEEGLAGLFMAVLIFMAAARTAYQRLITLRDASQSWRFIGVLSTLMGYFISAAIEQLWWPAFLIPVCLMAAYIFYQPVHMNDLTLVSFPDSANEESSYKRDAPLHRWRVWLLRLYLTLLLIFGATLIYANSVAGRFEQLTKTVNSAQTLSIAQKISQLQRFDPGLPMYSIAQGHYLGQHVIDTLGVAPCANPPADLPPAEKLNLEKAIRLYEQGLDPIKAHPLYWANLASLYWLNYQPDKAQTALTQAVNLSNVSDPNISLYLLNSGCYYELQGQPSAALTAYGRLVERNPALVNSAFWQASAFRAEYLPQIIDTASKHSNDRQQQLLIAIELEWAQGQPEKATQLINTLAAAFPDSVETLRWQAKSLLNQGKYQASHILAAKIEDYQLLGQIALKTGDLALAQTQLKKALFLQPDDVQTRFQLARVALVQGDQATAIIYLQRITSPYSLPTTTDSRFIYGYSTHFSIYDSLLIITPPPLQGQPYELLAQLYADNGDVTKAAEVRQALSTYDPYLKD